MWWSRKEHLRAGRKAQKRNGSKERMTTSLRVVVSREKFHRWRRGKILACGGAHRTIGSYEIRSFGF